MTKSIIIYGLVTALILLLLKWVDYRLFVGIISFEVYMGIIAMVFTALGIWMGLKLTSPKVIIEKAGKTFVLDEEKLKSSSISGREYDVLGLMARGLSNQEIADRLFISLNTVKTHVSSLFVKLDVKRRTQAIQRAKDMGLLP